MLFLDPPNESKGCTMLRLRRVGRANKRKLRKILSSRGWKWAQTMTQLSWWLCINTLWIKMHAPVYLLEIEIAITYKVNIVFMVCPWVLHPSSIYHSSNDRDGRRGALQGWPRVPLNSQLPGSPETRPAQKVKGWRSAGAGKATRLSCQCCPWEKKGDSCQKDTTKSRWSFRFSLWLANGGRERERAP